jgi:hypothetical protein
MTEVSNNIFSMYMQTSLGNRSRLLEQGDFITAYKRFFVDKEPHNKGKGYDNCFNRLVPFWQLYLYFSKAGKYTVAENPSEFYGDLFETMRLDNEYDSHDNGATNVRWCMDRFALHTSNVAETNMVKFFNDYGFNLSAATVAEINAKNYPQPAMEMRYIHDENTDLYKNNAPLTAGTARLAWASPGYFTVTMQPDGKNAVAYEVYESQAATEPIFITHNSDFSFISSANRGAVIIKAVGADGTRAAVTIAYE